MIVLRKATPEERRAFYETGETPEVMWYPLDDHGRKSASLVCPGCKWWGTLTDHEIGVDGTVTPSVVCGYGCGSHEDVVRLEGWEP